MSILSKLIGRILTLQVRNHGKNNIIKKAPTAKCKRSKIEIYGNNNIIILEDGVIFNNVHICLGFKDNFVENCTIKIGKNSGLNSGFMQIAENGSSISIGENCMISYDVEFTCSDTHAIFDKDNNLINVGKDITIGSNVWLGKEVKILKNTQVPDGCIVGMRSVVTKKFEEPNCVIAGNPAKIVKRDIHWSHKRPNEVMKKTSC